MGAKMPGVNGRAEVLEAPFTPFAPCKPFVPFVWTSSVTGDISKACRCARRKRGASGLSNQLVLVLIAALWGPLRPVGPGVRRPFVVCGPCVRAHRCSGQGQILQYPLVVVLMRCFRAARCSYRHVELFSPRSSDDAIHDARMHPV